ncbi:MAG: DUF1080 domain-containing protein [Acidobacteriia bacterium]|nr:DUF1080 domain-containing protein [Terriglobia bacterium]
MIRPWLLLAAAALASAQPNPGEWKSMFDGKSLAGWKETPFTSHGQVRVENGTVTLGTGYLTGINWAGSFPKINYEVRVEAARMKGSDFFAGITFPVGDAFCTWINGGWGGEVVGLSSLEENDASENETTSYKTFETGRWYTLRLRVTDQVIAAWIDQEQVIGLETANRTIGLRFGEIEMSKPFGIASYSTVAAIRKIEYRVLP